MRQSPVKQFEKRFSQGLEVHYSQNVLTPSEHEYRSESLRKAIREALKAILKREPTDDEISGRVDISKVVRMSRRRKSA